MREISKGHVYQFNDFVESQVSENDLDGFFKVTSTVNKLIAEKKIFEAIHQEK
jgi:MarR family transcriptional regulator, organic hydroperoxide resistance regulator